MSRAGLWSAAAVGLFLATGCAQAPAARAPSEALQRSRSMLAKLDRLEAELHDQNGALTTYGELQERHSQVSQIACRVTDDHVREIERLDLAQQKKRKEKALARQQKLHTSKKIAMR